jgi:hypothetical protein
VGRGETLLGCRLDVDAVAATDSLSPRDLLPGDELRDANEPFDLPREPAPPPRILVPALDVREQRRGLVAERLRSGRLFGVDGVLQLRRAEVAVDQPVQVLAEPEAELDVALGDLR